MSELRGPSTREESPVQGGPVRLADAVSVSHTLTLASWSHSDPGQLEVPRVRAPRSSTPRPKTLMGRQIPQILVLTYKGL